MSPRQAALAVDGFTVLVVVSVAVALAGLTWRIAGDPGHAPRVATGTRDAAPAVDVTPILALAPFGRPTAVAASPTSLGLQLRAILLTDPRSASTAIISSGGGEAQSFAVGQAVAGGAVIAAIEMDHVLLSVGGRTELLGFPRTGDPAVPVPPAAGSLAYPVPAPGGPPVTATPTNARAFLDSLGATATDGGYRIGTNPSATTRMAGLLPGDVIEKVNGEAVGDVERDGRRLDAAFRTGMAQVEVLRGGRRFTLSFALR